MMVAGQVTLPRLGVHVFTRVFTAMLTQTTESMLRYVGNYIINSEANVGNGCLKQK